MNIREAYNAGDVVQYEGGRLDYLIEIPELAGLWVNACNPVWINDGRRLFCESAIHSSPLFFKKKFLSQLPKVHIYFFVIVGSYFIILFKFFKYIFIFRIVAQIILSKFCKSIHAFKIH